MMRTVWLSSEHAATISVNKLQVCNLLDSENFRYNDLNRSIHGTWQSSVDKIDMV